MAFKPKPNSDYQISLREEFKKCAIDPVYFFRRYAVIEHPTKGRIPFKFFPFQEDTFRQFQQHRFNIILKSRQMGISTLVAGYALYCMLFRQSYKVLVIAVTQDVAKNIVTKVKVMHENLPTFLRGKVVDDNKMEFSFTNGSSIKAVSSSPSAARSHGLSLLIIDEFAFVQQSEEVWAASQMTLSTGGDAIVLSTPNGVGNQYHKLFTQAEEGRTDDVIDRFNPIRLPWHLHPERDEKWRKLQDDLLGSKLAAQECDCEFLTSGHTVIEGTLIQEYLDKCTDPIEKRGIGLDYWIWKYPDYSKDYVVFADVARGDGADNSSFQIVDVETLEQVAEYDGQIGTREFGRFLVSVATEWNTALLCVLNRNVGWDVVNECIQLGYTNLYYSYRNDPYLDPNIHIRKNFDLKNKSDKIPGFTETNPVRTVAVSKLITYLNEKSVKICSKRLVNQLLVFVWMNGKAQAASGYRDDLVIAYMYQLYMHENALKMRSIGIDMTKKALQKTFKAVHKPSTQTRPEWQQQVGNKSESLTWLL